jgi:hypothetical protein
VRSPRSLRGLLQRQSRRSSGAVADTAPPRPTEPATDVVDQTGSTGRNWEHADSLRAIESYLRSWAHSSEFIALWSEWRTRTDEGPEEAGGGHAVRRPIDPKTGPLGGFVTPVTQIPTVVRLWRQCIAESLVHGPCRVVDELRRHDAVRSVLGWTGLRRHAPVSAVRAWDVRETEGMKQGHRYRSRAAGVPTRLGGDARSPRWLSVVADTTATASMEDAGGDPSARDAEPMVTERPGLRLLPREHLHRPALSDNGQGSPSSTADHCHSGSQPVVLWDDKADPQGELSRGVDDASQRAA